MGLDRFWIGLDRFGYVWIGVDRFPRALESLETLIVTEGRRD